jgi:ubiquinone biosynthesis protein UbiJ
MPDYRTPLPGILAAMLEAAINRVLALDDASSERLRHLDGRMLQLDLEGVGITLYFAFSGRHVEVGTRSQFEPDTVISGSPYALFAMAAPEEAARWGSPGSRVSISGDATLARDLEQLFSRLDPDWEARLAQLLGDVWGHQVAAGLRAGAGQLRRSAEDAGDMLGEYLRRDGGAVVRSEELDAFATEVDELGEEIDRLERRLRKVSDQQQ